MVQIWPDLRILACNIDNVKNRAGKIDFGPVLINPSPHIYTYGPELFFVSVREDHEEDRLIHTICHEVEHYDVAKALLRSHIMTKADLSYTERNGTWSSKMVEWVHSDPSYFP